MCEILVLLVRPHLCRPTGSNRRRLTRSSTMTELRSTSRRLFLDGYYALAVEEAYKCLNNIVKELTGLRHLDGVNLMKNAFSLNNPVLKLNDLKTRSEKDQQLGYMEMFAAVITGVRNPRAHEHAYLDDPIIALELLGLANHLVRTARSAASRSS